MVRYLAVDYGGKRIGLAVCDDETRLAAPVATIAATGITSKDVRTVCGVADEYGIDAFVLGLPLNMDGTEGPQAKIVRKFGVELARASGVPVHYWDERLSSVSAEEKLAPAGLTRKKRKARIDRIAAQAILQEFMDSQPGKQPSERPANESMAEYYARRAPEYERIYEIPQRQGDLQILRAKLAELLAGRDVLELACGTGFWTQAVSRSARSVLATDINEEVIAFARTKDCGPAEVRFAIVDAHDPSAVRGTFGAVLAAFWWSHVPIERREAFLNAAASQLRPDGILVLCDNTYVEGESSPICRTDAHGNTHQLRTLAGGGRFEVVKNYTSESEISSMLSRYGRVVEYLELGYYWCVACRIGV